MRSACRIVLNRCAITKLVRPCRVIDNRLLDRDRAIKHKQSAQEERKHRLNRDFTGRFGSTAYAREELVAEMGSAFLCASLGIVPTVRHADYIGNWLEVLKNDSRAIVSAASHASKASDFLLAFTEHHDAEIAA